MWLRSWLCDSAEVPRLQCPQGDPKSMSWVVGKIKCDTFNICRAVTTTWWAFNKCWQLTILQSRGGELFFKAAFTEKPSNYSLTFTHLVFRENYSDSKTVRRSLGLTPDLFVGVDHWEEPWLTCTWEIRGSSPPPPPPPSWNVRSAHCSYTRSSFKDVVLRK